DRRHRAVDHRNEHGGLPRCHHAGALPRGGIEIKIAAPRGRGEVGERRGHLEGEPPACAIEEFLSGAGAAAHLPERHRAMSSRVAAGAMAKNSPPDATPNIAVPSTARSAPRSTRSKNSARVTLAQRSRRTWT